MKEKTKQNNNNPACPYSHPLSFRIDPSHTSESFRELSIFVSLHMDHGVMFSLCL